MFTWRYADLSQVEHTIKSPVLIKHTQHMHNHHI